MKLRSLSLSNFRCFGDIATVIDFDDLSCLIGRNGSGKSAVLEALSRLFGLTGPERTLVRTDFHIPADANPEGVDEANLFIEARLEFPELVEGSETEAVPECFNQMIVDEEGVPPYCRVRLEGKWVRSNLPDGDIEQNIYWVMTGAGEIQADDKKVMGSAARSRIHALYVPAARDPAKQLRAGSHSLLFRLLSAARWSASVREAVETAATDVSATFEVEKAVEKIREALQRNWHSLQTSGSHQNPILRPLSRDIEQVLRNVEIVFQPTPHGREDRIQDMSEGLQSLFYLSLAVVVFDIEQELLDAANGGPDEESKDEGAFAIDRLEPPSLMIFAVEEPENHLAPHYLGRIMSRLRKIASADRGQVVLTSHSPSILGRVEPAEVRYLRREGGASSVKSIRLPAETDDAHKYVQEAVRAYPELYFANLVVLGEGESEAIVLPRIARAHGMHIDENFVSFVPLGGRHVNHFWRLLTDLDIPFLTLLDLDREREGGGWGRLKYACQELLKIGVSRNSLLSIADSDGRQRVLTDSELDAMHTWDVTERDSMKRWAEDLEQYGVFFSCPLDLDFAMLRKFPDAYKSIVGSGFGPKIPSEGTKEFLEEMKGVTKAVLGAAVMAGATYGEPDRMIFFWYRYLFLTRSKPSTHLQALATLRDKNLRANVPHVLKRLIDRMSALVC